MENLIIKKVKRIINLPENERAQEFESLGFNRMKVRNHPAEIWKHEEGDVIVKRGTFLGYCPKRLQIPTTILGNVIDGPVERTWVVQPIADTTLSGEVLEEIKASLDAMKHRDFIDSHKHNVGRWNGKPVMFDW